jgi:hypothetical protein
LQKPNYLSASGLPDFTWYMIPKDRKKCTKWTLNVRIGPKISQRSVKCSQWPSNISTFSHPRPSKIYPNWDFWFENKPSGNPGPRLHLVKRRLAFQRNLCWPNLHLNCQWNKWQLLLPSKMTGKKVCLCQ